MNIHPRQFEELLKLRMLDKSSLISNASSSSETTGDQDFFELLETYLSNTDSTNEMVPAKLMTNSGMGIQTFSPSRHVAITDYDQIINDASNKYQVDRSLIASVIQAESGYKADAVSHAGAKGLMQLMDGTAAALGVSNSFDPKQNIEGGTKFLSYLLRKYKGNEAVALAAYNAGPGRIDRMGIANNEQLYAKYDELPKETQNYVTKVLGYREAAL
jgi:soluble lytic murein transglycosylase-like protein